MLEDVFKESARQGASPGGTSPPRKRRRRPGPAVLVPLLLLLLLGSVIYFFGFLSFDERSPRDLLREIRISSGERRAMAAFELSRRQDLEVPPGDRPAFSSEALQAFREEAGGDPRIRRALALTLGRAGDSRAVPELIAALEDADVETQLYSIWALGALRAPEAAGAIVARLHQEDPGIRKMAAFALGEIGNPEAVPALRVALQDSAADVTWNAAVALARLGDASALPVVLPLLRSQRPPPGLTPQQGEDLKINLIRSLRGLSGPAVAEALRAAAEQDPSARVRSEARRRSQEASAPPPAPVPASP